MEVARCVLAILLTLMQYTTVLCFTRCVTTEREQDEKVVKIAVILPGGGTERYALPYTKTAILLAIDYVRSDPELLPGYEIKYNISDSHYSDTVAPILAIDMFMKKEAHVFIGPGYDYSLAPVVRYMSFWNIPVVTGGGFAGPLDVKTEFAQLTRTGGSHTKLARFVNDMFKRLNWNTTGLMMYEDDSYQSKNCRFIMEALVKGRRHVNSSIWHKTFRDASTPAVMRELVKDMANNARIILICAPSDVVRSFVITAAELEMAGGDFAFINVDLFDTGYQQGQPWYREDDTSYRNQLAKKGYEALMTTSFRVPKSERYLKLMEDIVQQSKRDHVNGTSMDINNKDNNFIGSFYDAIILYASALTETLAANYSIWDGKEVTKRMWNRTFHGIMGNVSMDANGDRDTDYSLLDYNRETDRFEVVGHYDGSSRSYVPLQQIRWPGDSIGPPPDMPKCGFDGGLCPPFPVPPYAIAIIVVVSVSIIILVAIVIRERISRRNMIDWTIDFEEIAFAMEKNTGKTIKTGYYRGSLVAIRKIAVVKNLSKQLLMEVRNRKNMTNDHIVRFVGACISMPNQCIITEFCQKGSLFDILKRNDISLDSDFRYSLILDIVRGMTYLHNSDVHSHGNLTSSNCVVDSRFVLKITDFGLHILRGPLTVSENDSFYWNKQWVAPELLRMRENEWPMKGTQKGDIYSFAIICQEIIYRNGVFWIEGLQHNPRETYNRVRQGHIPHYRPTVAANEFCSDDLVPIIEKCWSEDPTNRPEFSKLKMLITKATRRDNETNILEILLCRMEDYANNLELLVDEKTANYLEQKQKVETLLYRMLPKSVAHQLMVNGEVAAERFDNVTIYFSDICNFTRMVGESEPMQVIALLSDLYNLFDSIAEKFDVYKVNNTKGVPRLGRGGGLALSIH